MPLHLAREAFHDQPLHIVRNSISPLFRGWIGLNAGDKLSRSLFRLRPSLGIKHSHDRSCLIGQKTIGQKPTRWLCPPLMFAHASLKFPTTQVVRRLDPHKKKKLYLFLLLSKNKPNDKYKTKKKD